MVPAVAAEHAPAAAASCDWPVDAGVRSAEHRVDHRAPARSPASSREVAQSDERSARLTEVPVRQTFAVGSAHSDRRSGEPGDGSPAGDPRVHPSGGAYSRCGHAVTGVRTAGKSPLPPCDGPQHGCRHRTRARDRCTAQPSEETDEPNADKYLRRFATPRTSAPERFTGNQPTSITIYVPEPLPRRRSHAPRRAICQGSPTSRG
jgi:hypothetical protein